MSYKYPTGTCSVRWKGGVVRLNPDQTWEASDPFVKANPGFFADEPGVVHRSGVEEATARPAAKRKKKSA